jgi:hypothetical protein
LRTIFHTYLSHTLSLSFAAPGPPLDKDGRLLAPRGRHLHHRSSAPHPVAPRAVLPYHVPLPIAHALVEPADVLPPTRLARVRAASVDGAGHPLAVVRVTVGKVVLAAPRGHVRGHFRVAFRVGCGGLG